MLIYKCAVRIAFDYPMLKICNLFSVMRDGYTVVEREEFHTCEESRIFSNMT